MMATVKIKAIVDNLGKNTKFLQPLYEAITNSLEANATNIEVVIDHDDPMENTVNPKITGFTITDNGVGFTKEHQESFCELWTDKKKLEFGCKGSGRYTWLSVYNSINIQSKLAYENQIVRIPFSQKFKDKDITSENSTVKILNNETKITFTDITSKFSNPNSVEDACLTKIYKNVMNFLLVRLFLLKKKERLFCIKLRVGDEEKVIDNSKIPDLKLVEFNMINCFVQQGDANIGFQLYYHFSDGGNSKQLYYCANDRVVKNVENDSLGFHAPFQDNASLDMLLCSKYFDDNCNDTRDDFPILSGNRTRSLDAPILMTDINSQVKIEMQKIIKERYPNIDEFNNNEEKKAIEEKPHLAEFIKQNTDIVKTTKSLIDNAQKKFNEQKIKVQDKFEKMLNDIGVIDTKEFIDSINEVSDVAAAELGEYILYRQQIIKALKSAIGDEDKKEKFIHNIIMKKNTFSTESNKDKYLLSNLWLLDDKFMTYSYALSDLSVKKANEIVNEENKIDSSSDLRKRPDINLFYNHKYGSEKDLVMVELKGATATIDEKNKSITELGNDIAATRKNISGIKTIWGYIITTIDKEFENTLTNIPFIPLFTNSSEKVYYKYYDAKTVNAHVFVLDLESIIADASARNKTFLEILKNK